MPMKSLAVLLILAWLGSAPTAWAQAEPDGPAWRLGVVAHNIHIGGYGDMQSHEQGPNLEGELVGAPIRGLGWLLNPRPYAELSANLSGDTSFAVTGLYWRWRPLRNWTLEPGFGLAVHDGKLHNPCLKTDPCGIAFQREHQLLGTRVLFRDSLALDRSLGEGRAVGLVFEHLSNGGNLFGHRDNESLNDLGLRYTAQFR